MIYDFRFAILRIAAAALIGLTPLAGRASLSAVVTPGYQYPLDGSVPLSYPLLNLLATPTITIYGTIGGSNTLSPGSVTGTELNANVLTGGGGLAFDGGNPPGIEVATGGVLTNMLNTNDWQWPLSQRNAASLVQLNYNPILFSTPTNLAGSGTNAGPFSFNYDTNVFGTNSAGLTVAPSTNRLVGTSSNGLPTLLVVDPAFFQINTQSNAPSTNQVATLTVAHNFVEATITLPVPVTNNSAAYSGRQVFTNAHNLGVTPHWLKVFLVCTNSEEGYGTNEEVDFSTTFGAASASSGTYPPAPLSSENSPPQYSISADATNVYFSTTLYPTNTSSVFSSGNYVPAVWSKKAPANIRAITAHFWILKIYARP